MHIQNRCESLIRRNSFLGPDDSASQGVDSWGGGAGAVEALIGHNGGDNLPNCMAKF